jgi:hypothetical protein
MFTRVPYRFMTARALFLFVLIDLGLHFFGFNRVYKAFVRWTRTLKRRVPEAQEQDVLDRTLAAVVTATRLYYRRRKDCVPKSLTIYYLVRKQGIDANLCIGVKKFPFAGHAWVEYGSRIVDDFPKRVPLYTVMTRV